MATETEQPKVGADETGAEDETSADPRSTDPSPNGPVRGLTFAVMAPAVGVVVFLVLLAASECRALEPNVVASPPPCASSGGSPLDAATPDGWPSPSRTATHADVRRA